MILVLEKYPCDGNVQIYRITPEQHARTGVEGVPATEIYGEIDNE